MPGLTEAQRKEGESLDEDFSLASHTPLWLVSGSGCRIGVLPERKKVFVGGERPDPGSSASAPFEVLDCKALARATPRCANAPVQQFQTMPLWSMIF